MKISTQISQCAGSDWAKVTCTRGFEIRYIDVFVPLASKIYQTLPVDQAVAKYAKKKFRDDGLAFCGYE